MLFNKNSNLIKKVNVFGKLRNRKKNKKKGMGIVSCLSNTTKLAAPSVLDIFQEMHYNSCNITPNIVYNMLYKSLFLTAETEILFFMFDMLLIYIDLSNRIKKINKTLKE